MLRRYEGKDLSARDKMIQRCNEMIPLLRTKVLSKEADEEFLQLTNVPKLEVDDYAKPETILILSKQLINLYKFLKAHTT